MNTPHLDDEPESPLSEMRRAFAKLPWLRLAWASLGGCVWAAAGTFICAVLAPRVADLKFATLGNFWEACFRLRCMTAGAFVAAPVALIFCRLVGGVIAKCVAAAAVIFVFVVMVPLVLPPLGYEDEYLITCFLAAIPCAFVSIMVLTSRWARPRIRGFKVELASRSPK